LDGYGIPSQFILSSTIKKASGEMDGRLKIGIFGNILKQMNAKVRLDIYRIKIPLQTAMVVGFDVVNSGTQSILGFTASHNKYMTQYFSKIETQNLRKDLIKVKRPDGRNGKDVQEEVVAQERAVIISRLMERALEHY
jgi:hypothetical protein